MPERSEFGPISIVWETDQETYDRFNVEYMDCDRALTALERDGRDFTPEAQKLKNRLYEIGNMFAGRISFSQRGEVLLAGIAQPVAYPMRSMRITPEEINPPEVSPVEQNPR